MAWQQGARRSRKWRRCAASSSLSPIFEQPYCRIGSLVERDIARRQTASVYLKQLVDIGVLEEQSAGREKLFVHPRLLRLMTQDKNEFTPYPAS